MHYEFHQKVLFKHCDPAGIVFYPRYFEILNDAIEAVFTDLLNWPFEELHKVAAVPTASLHIDFKAPSRHGDQLILGLMIKKLGTTSITIQSKAMAGEEERFACEQVLVHINTRGHPQPWPDSIRSTIQHLLKG